MRLIWTKPGEVKRLREELGLKQSDLAGRARIDAKTLRTIERGNRPVSAATLCNVARELRITVNALIETRSVESAIAENDKRAVRLTALPVEDLFAEIRNAAGVRWEMKVRPQAEQITLLRELESLVNRIKDLDNALSDGTLSSQLDAVAAMNDLQARIEGLNNHGVGVLAGSYLHWERDTEVYEGHGSVNYYSARTLMIALTSVTVTACELLPDLGEVPPDFAPDDGYAYYRNRTLIPSRPEVPANDDQEIPF